MDKESTEFINLFTNNIKYTTDTINLNNKTFIDIINKIYHRFINGIKWANDTYNIHDVATTIIEPLYINDLSSSIYFDEQIKQYISIYSKHQIKYNFTIDKRRVDICIITSTLPVPELYKLWINRIMVWIYTIHVYGDKNCGMNMNLIIYMTPFKKSMPFDSSSIRPYHVNSGMSDSCNIDSNIIIYRYDEWFKVLIHETFHNYGLDFASDNYEKLDTKISSIFTINHTIKMYETYTECWARILNTIHTAIIYDTLNTFDDFYVYFKVFIYFERCLSIYQCSKLLLYHSMYYDDIFSINSYQETTNVFAYYMGVAMLMVDPVDFILHNKNIKIDNVPKFYEYMICISSRQYTRDTINSMRKLVNKYYIKSNKMSLCLNIG
jgi:hypothetical protein